MFHNQIAQGAGWKPHGASPRSTTRPARTDTAAEFDGLKAAMDAMFERIDDRFELTLDPGVAKFHTYGVDGGPQGSIDAYSGPEVDWAIHSWIGTPSMGFTNLHLTVWLGPQVRVPHFGMAWGTLPDYWYFVDFVPRADLAVDLAYLDRYYEPDNAEYMALRDEPGFSPFVSQALYVRQSVSHTAHCFVADRTPRSAERMIELANAKLDRWFAHLDAAEPVPEPERAALAARDLAVRRNIADRDPANIMGVRFFGEAMTAELVSSLWGGNRTLPRPV